MLSGSDVTREPMFRRRLLLEEIVLPRLKEPVRYAFALDADLRDLNLLRPANFCDSIATDEDCRVLSRRFCRAIQERRADNRNGTGLAGFKNVSNLIEFRWRKL